MDRVESIQCLLSTIEKLEEELRQTEGLRKQADLWSTIALLNKSLAHETKALCAELKKAA